MNQGINILHLSDLHIGEKYVRHQKKALNKLKEKLNEVFSPDLPNRYIAISGDIVNCGKGFGPAARWINSLLRELELSNDRLVICPGNHDLDREALGKISVGNGADEKMFKSVASKELHDVATEYLDPDDFDRIRRFNAPFSGYESMCKNDLRIRSPYSFSKKGEADLYTFGVAGYPEDKVQFVILNSSWFCTGEENNEGFSDYGNLYLGSKLVEHIFKKTDPEWLTITLCHHPPEWLGYNDRFTYGGNPSSYTYVINKSNIILSGHEHGSISSPDFLNNSAQLFKNGSPFQLNDLDKNHLNNFSILTISQEKEGNLVVERNIFELDSFGTKGNELSWGHKFDMNNPYPLKPFYQVGAETENTRYYKLYEEANIQVDEFEKTRNAGWLAKKVLIDFLEQHRYEEPKKGLKLEQGVCYSSRTAEGKSIQFICMQYGLGKQKNIEKVVSGICNEKAGFDVHYILLYDVRNTGKAKLLRWQRYVNDLEAEYDKLMTSKKLEHHLMEGKLIFHPVIFLELSSKILLERNKNLLKKVV